MNFFKKSTLNVQYPWLLRCENNLTKLQSDFVDVKSLNRFETITVWHDWTWVCSHFSVSLYPSQSLNYDGPALVKAKFNSFNRLTYMIIKRREYYSFGGGMIERIHVYAIAKHSGVSDFDCLSPFDKKGSFDIGIYILNNHSWSMNCDDFLIALSVSSANQLWEKGKERWNATNSKTYEIHCSWYSCQYST